MQLFIIVLWMIVSFLFKENGVSIDAQYICLTVVFAAQYVSFAIDKNRH